jgi:hypothetical protein
MNWMCRCPVSPELTIGELTLAISVFRAVRVVAGKEP